MAQDHDPFETSRRRLLRSLLKKAHGDTYPSGTMLDTIEQLLTEDDVEDYADVLLSHIEDDAYPSISMIDRLRNLSVG